MSTTSARPPAHGRSSPWQHARTRRSTRTRPSSCATRGFRSPASSSPTAWARTTAPEAAGVAGRGRSAATLESLDDTRARVLCPRLRRCPSGHRTQPWVDAVEPLPADLNLAEAFGTTLLCALDLPDRLVAAYVGNGAIIHLRGDFPSSRRRSSCPGTRELPQPPLAHGAGTERALQVARTADD